MKRQRRNAVKFEDVPISFVSAGDISPSVHNNIYRPIQADDPGIIALVESIRQQGLLEPLLVSEDGFIISGHRRFAAAILAGLGEIPCRRIAVTEDHPDFLTLLRDANLQREKTRAERAREELISMSPAEAYTNLIAQRREQARVTLAPMPLRAPKARHAISPAKFPFLTAVQEIIAKLEDYWPLSDRQIHYQLLNDPPLIHASKPGSRYRNDQCSYKSLVELLTRARHAGNIHYEVITDATRPVSIWRVHSGTGAFVKSELAGMFSGYRRDLLQSQPNHIEIVAEKMTLQGILSETAYRFTVPITIGRGYCSTTPKYDIAQRFQKSGKEKLVLVLVSDFDPDGDEISHALPASLRDDFGIENIHPVRAALTIEQVARLHLAPSTLRAKNGSSNYSRFVSKYDSDEVYELEACEPGILQQLLTEAIDGVLDKAAFNAELDQEKEDAAYLANTRAQVPAALRAAGFDEAAA